MANVWVVAEYQAATPKKVTYELLTLARRLAEDGATAVVVAGADPGPVAGVLAAYADRSFAIDAPGLANATAEAWADEIAALIQAESPDIVLAPATFKGRELLTATAAALDVAIIQDATSVSMEAGSLVAIRPVYAGKALRTVRLTTRPQLATVRPNSYPPAGATGGGRLDTVTPSGAPPRAKVTGSEQAKSGRPDVSEADIIVSGGRGMGGPEHFHLVEAVADALGAAVGASRAVVDAGWRPHGEQVGQTGKTVSPTLYVACGISGAVQHLAGMKTSKVIVAINKDPEAPILQVADYGVVGDVFEVLPALAEAIRAHKAQ